MKTIAADAALVALCGLYCGACARFLKEKCPGCRENDKAAWCKVRSCCLENSYSSCADCRTHIDPKECGYFDNFMSRLFGFIFRSDRKACIDYLRANGTEAFARFMTEKRQPAIKR